eukprot:CAMPEP_0119266376 /NCGR_PEP_ID=MMETSP1329-20130426/4888_1 /TAXON_ID=114041 /ORGANISM="Genus nov. species nov., Strain RCC1024" /LENGTH=233 /DNA_ID=CAMNT_0007266251 /DNA_START=86 /DNA_END=784 /DNA_ORIENTATION=+
MAPRENGGGLEKLEEGGEGEDWTPGPEDVESEAALRARALASERTVSADDTWARRHDGSLRGRMSLFRSDTFGSIRKRRPKHTLTERREVGEDRLLDRSIAFNQSKGRMRIERAHASGQLLARDQFHSMVDAPLKKILSGLCLAYLAVICAFAGGWWAASSQCDVGIGSFNDAFLFSTSTLITVGYGSRDVFFDGCWEASLLLFVESMVGTLLDCLALGMVYSHISSGRRRSS